ncbi:lysozyme inhibitor LprI family protein [Halodurantibacterium flavum]|uniref:Lysozyme inhibitor LprI family protein n=1 Tax=Halodurantibacterium flavum TaxID=1382802 RepID=A0ABW4RZY1_9RHOB
MSRTFLRPLSLATLLMLPLPLAAQETGAQETGAQGTGAEDAACANATTQADLTACAGARRDRADALLNDAYAQAVAAMRDLDADPVQPGAQPLAAEETLRAAQRAWIAYRDAACEAEGLRHAGGSIRSMMILDCHTRLTEARTADLRFLLSPDQGGGMEGPALNRSPGVTPG